MDEFKFEMSYKDAARLDIAIDSEGFDYCFTCYSEFKDIESDKFHILRKQYIEARMQLLKFIDKHLDDNNNYYE